MPMKMKILLSISLLTISAASFGQMITMKKHFGGVHFVRDSITCSPKQVLNIMRDNDDAYNEFRKAKLNNSTASVLGFVGGVLVGIPLGTALAGGEPQWIMAAGGATLLLVSIPFSISFKKHAQQALNTYNASQPTAIKARLYFNGARASVVIKF